MVMEFKKKPRNSRTCDGSKIELNIKAQTIKKFSGGLNIILTFELGDTL